MAEEFKPLRKGAPPPRKVGGKTTSPRVQFYREQLQGDPGEWHIWDATAKHPGNATSVLCSLAGRRDLRGVDRTKLEYEVTTRANGDGTWTIHVRYVKR